MSFEVNSAIGSFRMPLKIIGSGFGRTGTKSTKDALEILGLVLVITCTK